jgi:hypothetical protein
MPRHAIMSLPLDHPHIRHSQLRMTERYTHVTQKLTQDAANRMGKALWG